MEMTCPLRVPLRRCLGQPIENLPIQGHGVLPDGNFGVNMPLLYGEGGKRL